MLNELVKKLEELPEVKYLKSENGTYRIVGEEGRLNLLIFLNKSEENKRNGGVGFIDTEKKGAIIMNSAGETYFLKNILPLKLDSLNNMKTERYENKLVGQGQKNDFTKDGFIKGVKHTPSILEQNYFSQTDSYVDMPTPDEFFMGPRGETIESDAHGVPSMDTFKFVTRYSHN